MTYMQIIFFFFRKLQNSKFCGKQNSANIERRRVVHYDRMFFTVLDISVLYVCAVCVYRQGKTCRNIFSAYFFFIAGKKHFNNVLKMHVNSWRSKVKIILISIRLETKTKPEHGSQQKRMNKIDE